MNIEPTISDRVILILLALFCVGMARFNDRRLHEGKPEDVMPSTFLGLIWTTLAVLFLLEAAGLL
jgi:hypothetical protein